MTSRFTSRRRRKLQAKLDQLVNESFAEPAPSVLFHYTTWAGLTGIVRTQTLWHTAHDCTNDPAEMTSADTRVLELAARLQTDASPPVKRLLEGFARSFGPTRISEKTTLYLACFSVARDKAKQWHDYADGGRGVCLGISVLKEEIRDERWPNLARASQRVLYDEGLWASLLEKAFRNVLEEFTKYINANGHDFEVANKATWSALSRIAAYAAISVKQPFWAPEEEWRQAAFSGPRDVATPLIRDAKGAEVRYLDLRMRTQPLRLAFSEILLGPRCDADAEDTKRILAEAGYSSQEIPPIGTSTVSE